MMMSSVIERTLRPGEEEGICRAAARDRYQREEEGICRFADTDSHLEEEGPCRVCVIDMTWAAELTARAPSVI